MGLLDNILREGEDEICYCCKCDAAGRPGCVHQTSQLRLPVCDTCPEKTPRPTNPEE